MIVIFLLVLSLLASGCSKQSETSSKRTSGAAGTTFSLTSATLNPLYNNNEPASLQFPIANQAVSLAAEGFTLDLTFSEPLDFTHIQNKITLIGTSQPFTVEPSATGSAPADRGVTVTASNLSPGNYQLMISSQLSSAQGDHLTEQVVLNIRLETRTQAEFFLLDSSGLPRPLSYSECSSGLALSDTDKTFLIHFSQDVLQGSVEDSLRQGLQSQPANIQFSWTTPRQLRIILKSLQTDTDYELLLNQARDSRGYAIMGRCRFRTGKNADVGRIDLKTRKAEMLCQFSEERYSGLKDPYVKDQLILQAGNERSWVFGVNSRQLTSLPNLCYALSLSQNQLGPVWLDPETLLAYDQQTKGLILVSCATGNAEPFYTLPSDPLECSLSPDGSVLAVVTRHPEKSSKVDLLLLDIQNAALKDHEDQFAQGYVTEDGLLTINLTWEDNTHFVYYDDRSLKRAFLTTKRTLIGRQITLESNARLIASLPNQSVLVYQKLDQEKDNIYQLRAGQTLPLKGLDLTGTDTYCILIAPEILVYQKDGQIFRYDTDIQTVQPLASGMLIGGSDSGELVYFMTHTEDFPQVPAS
jgi:hypothetical protein